MLKRFLTDASGGTAIEYSIIAALIFLAIVAAIVPIGLELSGAFDQASDGLTP